MGFKIPKTFFYYKISEKGLLYLGKIIYQYYQLYAIITNKTVHAIQDGSINMFFKKMQDKMQENQNDQNTVLKS